MDRRLEDSVLFENAEWRLTAAGLEHKGNGYFIERETLGARRSDGFWLWPFHMLEKTWCAPRVFADAFAKAVQAYELADQDLADSLGAALRLREAPMAMAMVCAAGAPRVRPRGDRRGDRGERRIRRAGQAHPVPGHRASPGDDIAITV